MRTVADLRVTTQAAPSGLHKTPLSRKVVPGTNAYLGYAGRCRLDAMYTGHRSPEVADLVGGRRTHVAWP